MSLEAGTLVKREVFHPFLADPYRLAMATLLRPALPQTMATFRILGLDSGADIIVCIPPSAYARIPAL